ncbi:hypothetical protein N799_14215 [Lysobacter arseniciresistens ZS79]|uniref:Inner membrane protein n=1 Tax=Lysobacter arseniciresistens ZS79 TaxID=913325 RepID=A0A0A0F441_9GAMM|nr:cell envelope integrity protein CreD [Lysobacter arseniciresistens]KGM57143.1 hypothetical protein N799_14215 [Lysobacter arseniciresistens ZS79]
MTEGRDVRLWMKMVVVIGMTLAILVPLAMVRGVVHERQEYRQQVVRDVAASHGRAQTFAGPVLVVPYRERVEVEEADAQGIVRTASRVREDAWTFFPTALEVDGELRPDVRRRNLHQVRVYEWDATAMARFEVEIPADPGPAADRRIGEPYLSYAIGDVSGLRRATLEVDGTARTPEPGQGYRPGEGMHVRLAALGPGRTHRIDARLGFVLAGTERLSVLPLGDSNTIVLSSSWPHPGFGGASPRRREIGRDGFRAEWDIPGLATNARDFLLHAVREGGNDGPREVAMAETVGVTLVDPVDAYAMTDRATKYGLLFVLLTFVGFFIFELVKQLPIHPIQYGLVGLALAIFFLLLLSLGEHFPFGWSYLAAAVACIGLIAFYLSAVLRSVWRALGFAAMLATLYACLYGLLVSEDNALVLGAGLLFVILAALMTVTRKVDWYQLGGALPRVRP